MVETNPNQAYTEWLDDVANGANFGQKDCLGSANFIDDAARKRAADSIRTGRCVSLARPLHISHDTRPGESLLTVEISRRETSTNARGVDFGCGTVNSASDVLHVAAHGQRQTHLDGLNHYGRRGMWYSGFAVDDPEGPEISDLATHMLFTRGVLVDIPAVRGTSWVQPDQPVNERDIDGALQAAGVTFEPGDALLLYLGRDRYEAAGHRMDLVGGAQMPGAGPGAARWIVEHGVSLLCWDFLDAVCDSEPSIPVHLLIWAIGLLLVDNCDFGRVVDEARSGGSSVGGLVVAPPPLPQVTGCLVGPLFVQ
jgi:kynurenine formamidase